MRDCMRECTREYVREYMSNTQVKTKVKTKDVFIKDKAGLEGLALSIPREQN